MSYTRKPQHRLYIVSANPGMDWEFLSMSKQFRSEFVPYGDATYELVVVVSASQQSLILIPNLVIICCRLAITTSRL